MNSLFISARKKAFGVSYVGTASVFLFLFSSTSSYAIPSPDLVVGSLSSISQLIAIVSAMIGGGAAVAGMRATANGRANRIVRLIAAGAALFLGLSLAGNYYQYSTQRSERQARLESAITRPTETSDGHTLDPNLKEASYDEQIRSSRGISTDDVERLLKDKERGLSSNEVLIDVRENAETATGSLPNATAIRFPDFKNAHMDLTGKTAILFCDNGNRSYQTCQELSALGIDCRFMVGGLEKWLAERRPLAAAKATSLADFRPLPSYPNKAVLLDTPDVRGLVAHGAVFVDVRYPGEFAAYHLPGAINLPIRPTKSDELHARIAALPHRPIIAPCYDRRSCFYAQVLGFEVTQAGYDFRGRYTLPWDYFVPLAPRPYILKYLNESHRTWWGKLVGAAALFVNRIADYGSFLLAIISLAVLSRLLVLPFSWKSERDQIVARELAPHVEELKSRLQADPRRLARALRTFYRRNGLTPFRNMLGLAFLPLMSVCVAAIYVVAIERHQSLLWVADAANHDLTFILPIIFAALICIYIDSAFVTTLRHRFLVWIIGMIVLTATGGLLSAAADVYLVASAALLVVQRAAVTNKFHVLLQWFRRIRLGDGIVSLDDVQRLAGCGNKAHRLGIMRSRGFTVPEGVVLTARFLEKFSTASPQWRSRQLDCVWRNLRAAKLVVRSSGSAEDGSANSFAGVFESVLNVDRAGLEAAVADVLASFSTGVVAAYGAGYGHANIVIQRMIEPNYSGVLFTRDPACPSHSLVEIVEGTADKLVGGAIAPILCRFGRVSQEPIGGASPVDLKPLVAIGQQLESLFSRPQDVEWAYLHGVFYLVQSRDITRLEFGTESEAAIQHEWSRALDCAAGAPPDAIVFEQNELSEVLPRPTNPSLSLMETLWASGGSIDLACRKLGLGYRVEEDLPSYLVTIFGRLYVSKRQEIARAPGLNALARWRMNRISKRIIGEFRGDFLPAYLKRIALLEAADFDTLSTADLLDVIGEIHERFVSSTSVTASVINIAADYYLRRAKETLIAAGLEPAKYLAHADQTEFERIILDARKGPADLRHETLVRGIGHRSSIDYELAEPRYAEMPAELDKLIDTPVVRAKSPSEICSDLAGSAGKSNLISDVLIACSFQTLKEDAKHHSLRELAVLRRAILAADRRFAFDGLIFQLSFAEIETLGDETRLASLRANAGERRHRAELIAKMSSSLSPALTITQMEASAFGIKPGLPNAGDKSVGIRVSGSGIAEGRACVVVEDDASVMKVIPGFMDGDIVISRTVPPAWIPYFQRAGGFVCEVGGWLSHTAIVAREFNVPLIVQAKGIRMIETGELIRLHPDGAVEVIMTMPRKTASA